MPKQTKICRVCGATYEACQSVRTGSPVFNWREVACSPECGEIYLKRVMEARSPKNTEQAVVKEPTPRKKNKKPIVLETAEEVVSKDNEYITE